MHRIPEVATILQETEMGSWCQMKKKIKENLRIINFSFTLMLAVNDENNDKYSRVALAQRAKS